MGWISGKLYGGPLAIGQRALVATRVPIFLFIFHFLNCAYSHRICVIYVVLFYFLFFVLISDNIILTPSNSVVYSIFSFTHSSCFRSPLPFHQNELKPYSSLFPTPPSNNVCGRHSHPRTITISQPSTSLSVTNHRLICGSIRQLEVLNLQVPMILYLGCLFDECVLCFIFWIWFLVWKYIWCSIYFLSKLLMSRIFISYSFCMIFWNSNV